MPEHGGFKVSVEPPRARDDLAGLSGADVANDAAPLVLPPGRVVRGRVVDGEGKPVRAEVRVGELGASDDGPPGYGRSVETSDDGRFTIRGLRREPVALRAHPLGGRLWDEDDRPFTTVGVETSDVRLVLVRPATVEVRVVGPDGQPVRSADVAVRWGSRTSSETVEGGIVTVPRRAGEQLVGVARAVGSDGAPLAPGHAAVRSGIDTVELRLAPGAEVRGRVVNASGEPVAGATVGVSPKREATADGLDDVFGLLETWGSARTSGPQALVRTTTGADGGFVARGLPTGACVVSVLPPAPYGPREDVPADGGGKEVEIVVATSVTYRVTVVDAEGHPLAGASVKVIRRKAIDAATTQYLHDPVLTTDASGEVTVGPLRPADGYGLEVAPPDGRADLLDQSFSRWTPGELRVELAFARTLRGRVVDGRGAPIPGARVSVLGRDTASIRDVPTGTDGRFRLPGVPREGVRLIARLRSTPDSVEETGTLAVAEGDDDVVVRIDRHTTWRFTVDAKPGRALTLWFGPPADRSVRAGKIAEGGRCVLEGVPVRRAMVFVPPTDDDDRCGYLPDVEVTEAPIVVPMQPARTITIRLRVPEGAWIDYVHVLGPEGPMIARHVEGDLFLVSGLPAGRFPVKAKVRGPLGWMSATVEAEAGTEVEVVPK
ncbi:MAG: carboxypeptidase regulatory-like domain-containing protein [Planctomycetia bacterium]|nr:carboxypeptidase regulatory-like domain-containing protein [Planctomycetia bacterium]